MEGYETGPMEHTANKILWGQFYRFLPIKYTLRILASISTDRTVTILDWQDAIEMQAFDMRSHLRAIDVRHRIPRGSQLASGFPKKGRKSEQSMGRFLSHYSAVIQGGGSGPVVGMPAEMGFIHVKRDAKEVRLTDAGLVYVNLRNPQFDNVTDIAEQDWSPISEEEQAFLLGHIKSNLEEDWVFCKDVLHTIGEHGCRAVELEDGLSETNEGMSGNLLRTSIVGALGRLGEIGLIERTWVGRKVTYNLTELGAIEVE